jgi:hypothetical protein
VRTQRRPRRHVPGWGITILRPLFRYSATREAHVLRVIGRRWGPVLTPAPRRLPAPAPRGEEVESG